MKYSSILIMCTFLTSCSNDQKNLSSVKAGMNAEQVILHAGEPDKKNNIGIAELWIYKQEDRTVVFRKDTVFEIITSADARVDSIKNSLDHLGDNMEIQAEKGAEKLKNLGQRIRNKA